ncbi:carbohydrate ABC transporter membrane protein 1, CUT1 family [Clostridium sp. USBA 49]|uniref:carbohydrate ABC transporter permease n=1 Tax=Clostridium sp. USBA 49 TaxID=1881060 RepID=UPI0009CF9D6B|nr:sugar ABC transporter permease [Clostridium sp. USBA 49]SKA85312.1 carbohydrate ABC transporter membrane protein 1, CUT1 family [Clostridium sp. USBA 49]
MQKITYKMSKKEKKETIKGYLFISPWLIGFLLFTLYPMIFSLYSGFTFYDITSIQKWIGLKNYINIFFHDEYFITALKNTAYYVIFSVPLAIIFALLLALLLNTKVWGVKIFRTVYYLPSVLSGVAVTLLWMWIFNPSGGLANTLLGIIGINGPAWFNDPKWSKPALIIMRLWGVGGSMILFLAALQDVPRSLYEAAEIDGATGFKKFLHVTLPMISPTLLFVMITGINGAFQIFDGPFIISGGTGGPANSTLFYNLYLYNKAFLELQMGYASALAWVLFIIIMIFTGIQLYVSKKWVHYEGGE